MEVPKPQRIVDPAAIKAVKKSYCERDMARAFGEPHYIRTVGSGGPDVKENLIQLCWHCHVEAQDYRINPAELIEIVARREGKPIAEIYMAIGWPPPEVEPVSVKKGEPSLEEMVQAFISLQEQQNDCQWAKGQLLNAMIKAGAKASWIASQVNISAAQVRELDKVYRAFPDPGTRIPELSWYHHRVAANSPDPIGWIIKAADRQMSTRELRNAILNSEATATIQELAKDEAEREQQKVEAVFHSVENILRQGGESALWLVNKLRLLLSQAA